MRTRTSNRQKRYTVEKYDFDSSSDEVATATPSRRRRKDPDEQDANFDDAADEHAPDEDDGSDEAVAFDEDGMAIDDEEDGENDDAASDAPKRRRDPVSAARKPARRNAPVRSGGGSGIRTLSLATAQYRDVEPVPPDSHAVKTYSGPYERAIRGQSLIQIWYGPNPDAVRTTQRLLDRWIPWPVLPPKVLDEEDPQGLPERGVWAPGCIDRQFELGKAWSERWKGARGSDPPQMRTLSAEEAAPYQPVEGALPVFMGPYLNQTVVQFAPGDAVAISQNGIPFDRDEDKTKVPAGWMLDTGGVVVGMDWAPRQGESTSQVLALAVIPRADHDTYNYEEEHQRPGFERHGTVQVWEFCGERTTKADMARPLPAAPRLLRTLCLDCGRARRVKWSPGVESLLAILCGDGSIRVLEVTGEGDGSYEEVEAPLAVLSMVDELGVKATAMDWVSVNRLVAGYSDGSVALWSIFPTRLLSRHPVHHSDVIALATGYPSEPYLAASLPVGGSVKIVDLRCPSYETAEVQINAVNTEANMLAWSDHLQGFFSAYPSANALNTMVGFMHHRHFPLVRRIFTAECFPSCLSVGTTHPCLLVGTTDGSLWALNPQCELFKARRPPTDRVRLLQHEHRPAEHFTAPSPASARGVARVVQGFDMEKNTHGTETRAPPKKGNKAKKGADADDGGGAGDDEPVALMDPSRAVVHELGTRVTVVSWNPNDGYGCWAAAAFGSGLVRVMDLGLENVAVDE
ncbi:hypothetical protein JDV02_009716 [Purpureocillium takamizusanense]|uniref:Transcription factor TFIIIC complex subunit Tfc6 n=1 Tax=Purpureocillium takamizusanense TaxID=2060973 RepID=A0A9Q8QS99_9HYPO|nr:uncharacterized protein JDV02_009716 [Purpureocillium takamizusanense]UNI23926.1 hypothetical protein JDV02_009716 [Purpureocillium takamizusanense]